MSRDADRPAGFHSGELSAQARAGQTAEAAQLGPVVKPFLAEGGRSLITSARTAVATTIDSAGAPTLSMLVTTPGGFGTLGACGLTIPRSAVADEDCLFDNLHRDRRLGLAFLEPTSRRRFRVNGEVVDSRRDPLEVSILEAFPNCTKYLLRQRLATASARRSTAGAARARSGSAVTERDADLLTRATLVFVGSGDPGGQLDAATRSGDAGFVREVEPGTFEIPDFAGNAMYQTIGNLLVEPRASIAFIDDDDLVVLTGAAAPHWQDRPERPGGNGRFWRFTPGYWRRVTLPAPVRLGVGERSAHTPVLDGSGR